jgi:crotonobetainyl-CoA:carnitine CoA-transferase CaiB-like acyl-CoA transferase
VLGGYFAWAYPARLAAGPRVNNRRPAPMLGEHKAEILSGLLGLSSAQIGQLERDGVIGTRPAGADTAPGFR